jgi:26S proteasome regulatory subunit (ATPase 3-interacting protein)
MAPRKCSPLGDSSSINSPLKAKTESARVTKAKAPKRDKADGDKIAKPKAVKKEKKIDNGEEKEQKFKKSGTEGVKRAAGDGKEKVKVVIGEEAIELILKYLKEQNRPYSATEVSANLHGKV